MKTKSEINFLCFQLNSTQKMVQKHVRTNIMKIVAIDNKAKIMLIIIMDFEQ